ncbi:MAG: inner membrane CreD family protein [Acidobacteria bacterium]|nr:inner membrane CreD family protein [Acidobacteriota bacterium]
MTALRVLAVAGIFILTSLAWLVLGLTIVGRTQKGYENIGPRVENLWGQPLTQMAPSVQMVHYETKSHTEMEGKRKKIVSEKVAEKEPLDLDKSDITTDIMLEYRRKGLLWFPGYVVNFAGAYAITNPAKEARQFIINFTFPSTEASYDEFVFAIDGKEDLVRTDSGAKSTITLSPGQTATIQLGYKTRGMKTWSYAFGQGVQRVRNFSLVANTNFNNYDFPEGTISPAKKELTDLGSRLRWESRSLLSGFKVGIDVPEKLNPGDVASRIAFFAPVGLFFFFVVMTVWSLIRRVNLHPMHFVFLAAGFFAFHLLFAYLVDHMSVNAAFSIAALVSLGLVVNYMRLVTGLRFALAPTGLAQLVYLILFSYAFFFKGFTGLAITIGAVLTLAVLMQVTGKVDWERSYAPRLPERKNDGLPPTQPDA